jgi:biopolymer transport protein ExbD
MHPYGNSKLMADVTNDSGGGKRSNGKVRARKRSTKIDMTPMVDLAFLLLTFFILTSTFRDLRILRVEVPKPVDDVSLLQPINEKNVLNLVLAENNKIYWWVGIDSPAKLTDYSQNGVRKILLEEGRANPKLMVVIKAKDDCRYENMVDILDEVVITAINRYAIVDFTPEDADKIVSK